MEPVGSQGWCAVSPFENPEGTQRHLHLVVPRNLHEEVLQDLHAGISGGHLGEENAMGKLCEHFYWPGQWRDVQNWCQTCATCATRKTQGPKETNPLKQHLGWLPDADGCC